MSETPPLPSEPDNSSLPPEPAAGPKFKWGNVWALSLPLILIGLGFGAYRLHQWFAVRDVFVQISQQTGMVKTTHATNPSESSAALSRRYGRALAAIDASHTPQDFQEAFHAWVASWKIAADQLEQAPNSAQLRKSINAPTQAAAEQLDALRKKYTF